MARALAEELAVTREDVATLKDDWLTDNVRACSWIPHCRKAVD